MGSNLIEAMIVPFSSCTGDARRSEACFASDAGARARPIKKIVQTTAKRGKFNTFIRGDIDFLLKFVRKFASENFPEGYKGRALELVLVRAGETRNGSDRRKSFADSPAA
ncbi:MAG: hypothetical protein DMF68_20960 [Acidobacteria bacterium]|nr:MAG: hypothetical protein DMF68_20960 [Acidobacteriota bacterium]